MERIVNKWKRRLKLKISREIRDEIEAVVKKEALNKKIFHQVNAKNPLNGFGEEDISNLIENVKIRNLSSDVAKCIVKKSVEKIDDKRWRWVFLSGMEIIEIIEEIDPVFFVSFSNVIPNIRRFFKFSSKEKIEAEKILLSNKIFLYYKQ